jgi:hypothetical protein
MLRAMTITYEATDDGDNEFWASLLHRRELEMTEHANEVLARAIALRNEMADAADAGRSHWQFVGDDEPSAVDTLEAAAAVSAFIPCRWWR